MHKSTDPNKPHLSIPSTVLGSVALFGIVFSSAKAGTGFGGVGGAAGPVRPGAGWPPRAAGSPQPSTSGAAAQEEAGHDQP